jgi:hypothetical protein
MPFEADSVIMFSRGNYIRKRGIIFLFLATAIIFSLFQVSDKSPFIAADIAFAQEEWKSEFDALCSKTQHAMTFSPEELKDLVARCDTLKPLIEKLEGPKKKVLLRKLQKCRNLFQFVLDSKEAE